jgi:hypothetical protein
VPAFAVDLAALLLEREPVDLDHVVEHAREHFANLAVGFPIEAGILRERIDYELGEIDRSQETRTVGR